MIEIKYALRDERVNIIALTYGRLPGNNEYQIMLCKKLIIPKENYGPFLLIPKLSQPQYLLSTIGNEYLRVVQNHDYKNKYIAYIDAYIKISINIDIFNALYSNGFFSIWDPGSPVKYFDGNKEGYLVLFRVYEAKDIIPNYLFAEGARGRNFYFKLKEPIYSEVIKPVLDDEIYQNMKIELLRILEKTGQYQIIINNYKRDFQIEESEKILMNVWNIDNVCSELQDDEAKCYPEGRVLYAVHRKIERNSMLIDSVKRKYKEQNGDLRCMICDISFYERYGDIGRDFIEAHHTKPVSEMKPDELSKPEDIALLCPNCHRMVHRRKPLLRIDELKNLLNKK